MLLPFMGGNASAGLRSERANRMERSVRRFSRAARTVRRLALAERTEKLVRNEAGAGMTNLLFRPAALGGDAASCAADTAEHPAAGNARKKK